MLETIKFILNHKDNWRQLLKESPYCLSINEDNDYAILKYNQLESDFNEAICRECRGLIIDLHTFEPVALSFFKFFNYQEPLADHIFWKDCRVQEKVDGSKILVWFDKYHGTWEVSTSGQLDAYEAKVMDFGITFGELFDEAVKRYFPNMSSFFELLREESCYTFELVSPESRVVIRYEQPDIYFTGLRDVKSFAECDPDSSVLVKYIKRPKEFPLTNINQCIEAASKMNLDQEGFVVVDCYWKRIKIKSPMYVSAHFLRNNVNVSKSKILEIIEKGEQSEFLGYFPEYAKYFDEVESKLKNYQLDLGEAIEDIKGRVYLNKFLTEKWTRKDFAKYINTKYKEYSSFLFSYLDANLTDLFIKDQWSKLNQNDKMKRLGLKGSDKD